MRKFELSSEIESVSNECENTQLTLGNITGIIAQKREELVKNNNLIDEANKKLIDLKQEEIQRLKE